MTQRDKRGVAEPTMLLEIDLLVMLACERAGELNDGENGRYEINGPAGSETCMEIAEHCGVSYAWELDDDGEIVRALGWRPGEFGLTEGTVRSTCKRLCREGLMVEYRPKHGNVHYGLSPDGDVLLRELAGDGELPELPESPKCRSWRERRERALAALPQLRGNAYEALSQATEALAGKLTPDALMIVPYDDKGRYEHCRWPHENVGSRIERAVEKVIEALQAIDAPEPE